MEKPSLQVRWEQVAQLLAPNQVVYLLSTAAIKVQSLKQL